MPNTKIQEKKNLAHRLAEQEKFILRKAKEWYLEGKALLEIRDKKLYLGKYSSFADYCKNKWGFSKRHANMQISGYLFVSRLGTMVPTLPANERQARPFTGLNPDLQKAAWVEVLRTAPNGEITSNHAHAVAQKYKNGSRQVGTIVGTKNTENPAAPTFNSSSVLQQQPDVDLSANQEDEELAELKKQLEEERNLRIQSQYEGLVKDQKIDSLTSEASTLAEQIEENQSQITSLKNQINTMQPQITNLMNQVGQLRCQYKDLHFIHTHLTNHAYNLQKELEKAEREGKTWQEFALERLKRVPNNETEQTKENVVAFPRKDLDQDTEQWRSGRYN